MHRVTEAPTEVIVMRSPIGQENRFVITRPRPNSDIPNAPICPDYVIQQAIRYSANILSNRNYIAKPAERRG